MCACASTEGRDGKTYRWLKRALSRRRGAATKDRRVRIQDGTDEEETSDRFVLIVMLMITFFAGLIALEIIHMVFMGTWNETVFNGIMLVVGTIVGAVWGRSEA